MARVRKRPPQGRLAQNPDRGEVCSLMARTWPRPGWEYTAEVLSAYLDRPSGDASLTVGLYHEDDLAGYEVFIPYTVMYEGVERKVVYATFWTSDPDSPVKSIALKVHKELFRLSREKGYSGFFSVTHADSHADQANQVTLRWLQEDFCILKRFGQLMCRPSRVRKKAGDEILREGVMPYAEGLRGGCAKLVTEMTSKADVARTIPRDDIDYVFAGRPGTRTWVHEAGGEVRGLVNVMVKKLVGEDDSVNAYIEHALFGDMPENERRAFLGAIAADPFWDGITGIYIPRIGYFDEGTFRSLGFMKVMKEFNLYFIPLDDTLGIDDAPRIYMDIF